MVVGIGQGAVHCGGGLGGGRNKQKRRVSLHEGFVLILTPPTRNEQIMSYDNRNLICSEWVERSLHVVST